MLKWWRPSTIVMDVPSAFRSIVLEIRQCRSTVVTVTMGILAISSLNIFLLLILSMDKLTGICATISIMCVVVRLIIFPGRRTETATKSDAFRSAAWAERFLSQCLVYSSSRVSLISNHCTPAVRLRTQRTDKISVFLWDILRLRHIGFFIVCSGFIYCVLAIPSCILKNIMGWILNFWIAFFGCFFCFGRHNEGGFLRLSNHLPRDLGRLIVTVVAVNAWY